MSVKPLTVTEVKGAKPREKDFAIYDGFGLLLHVASTGGKVWRFRYSHPVTKKRQTYTVGRFPEFTLAEAREVRDELRRMLARDIDPATERKNLKAEAKRQHLQTFKAIALAWLNIKLNGTLRKPSIKNIEYETKKYLIPFFGEMMISDITAPVAIAALKSVSDKSALQKKLISRLNEIMTHAVNCGVIIANPLVKIKSAFNGKKTKSLAALPIESLPEFINWWENTPHRYQIAHNALLFQILTMVRPGEAINAEWNEIDFDSALWVIPEHKMKAHREHAVPLSTQAIAILKEMEKIKRGTYIFYSSTSKNSPMGRNTIKTPIAKSKFHGIATLHGFRSMWSTLLNEEGFNPDVIEAALAHKSGDAIRDIYNRTNYMEQRRIMMQWVGDFFDAARRGIIQRSGGKKGLRVVNE
ncbi:TPA: tyrosine-type recombinase/integrase [Salmonella enterica]|nr:tyrosine-type recombinase/integrase [Salmonella enterica]HDC2560398.1 tyrosine-type recombinase/integrase [Salmonella enterica]